MSTQLEFIMQLYMMNFLQQQQQQQQQQQIQNQSQQQQQFGQILSPTKQFAIPTTTTTFSNNAATDLTPTILRNQRPQQQNIHETQQQQQQLNTRTHKRQNSQNINCSSSRSCSPNSNSNSFIPSNKLAQNQNPISNQTQTQPMLLLNNLPPLTQFMLQQQYQQQQNQLLTTPSTSSLLLTPTTPNSLINNSSQAQLFKSAPPTLADYFLGNSNGCASSPSLASSSNFNSISTSSTSSSAMQNFNPCATTPNVANISFTAQNFLQSSTVTSTPTEEKRADGKPDGGGGGGGGGGDDDDDDDNNAVVATIINDSSSQMTQHISTIGHADDDDLGDDDGINEDENEENDNDNDNEVDDDRNEIRSRNPANDGNIRNDSDEEEDDLPLSILQTSSSGVVSSCTTSGENSSKFLLSSGLQTLESSATTMDETNTMDSSSQAPYTPIKQEADSSLSCSTANQQPLSLCNNNRRGGGSGGGMGDPYSNSTISEDSNMTPLALAANAILTPPSSEQLITNLYDSNTQGTTFSSTAPPSTTLSLTTASSLDAFLQNEENLKNLKKFSSYLECENPLCRQENLREHFHCYDEPCQGKILSKKDDIIRHLKWHKKRKESLQLGFARFSSSDDCEPAYGANCAYNWKQTHYHCVYEDCPKVYVSTSDVQMHANFHRKNSEIVQEGFRRFRAHENCKIEECPFYGKKTSHYHCCREGCNHTFKNKADMDKHKSYHLKDYQLTQDGFKKILKTEVCPFDDCKFSTVCNHIHCVRENCNYILHSSSQMISHKRKHDRSDGEQAYQNFKKLQKESSEDESPTTTQQQQQQQMQQQEQQQQQAAMASCASNNMSTPLSSHTSAEQFLSRKRGRPPKMIQLPADSTNKDSKRFKLEPQFEQQLQQQQQQQQQQLLSLSNTLPSTSNLFTPFLPNFNTAAAATAMQQSIQSQDPNAPNFQLTHLMALFQLQNPLFYQNLYPGGMAGMLAAGALPQNASMLGNLAALNAAAAAAASSSTVAAPHIKSEFNEKQQFKE